MTGHRAGDFRAEWVENSLTSLRADSRFAVFMDACFGSAGLYMPVGRILVLWDGPVMAAVGCYSLHGGGVASLHTGGVAAAYRGLGLHHRLVRDRVAAARSTCSKVYACSHRLNAPVLASLRAEGFRECDHFHSVSVSGPDWVTLAVELSGLCPVNVPPYGATNGEPSDDL